MSEGQRIGMKMKRRVVVLALSGCFFSHADEITHGEHSVSMDFVAIDMDLDNTVGDNAYAAYSYPGGFGVVDYAYNMGKYEVTVDQWNAVAAADSRINAGSSAPDWTGSQPAAGMSWYGAAIFCNWLTSGDAYAGVYQFDGSGTLTGVDRAAALLTYSTVYTMPSNDEWVKAAYWTGSGYTIYPTGNTTPTTLQENSGSNGLGAPWAVGSGEMEQNGTYDMAGNLTEWLEGAYDGTLDDLTKDRLARDTAFAFNQLSAKRTRISSVDPTTILTTKGFRVVQLSGLQSAPDGSSLLVRLTAVPAPVAFSKEFAVDKKYLLIPVDADRQSRQKGVVLQIFKDGQYRREFRVLMPEDGKAADWMAFYPVDEFAGGGITVRSREPLPFKYTEAAERDIVLSDEIPDSESDYTLPYRNQFMFTTRRGKSGDVNGLVYNNGTYHLYYQYNPFNIGWDNMHWGHAVSTDLVHWVEKDIAIYQRSMDDMIFSGNGFLDIGNTSGLSPTGEPLQFAAFTSTGRGECLAYTLDGGDSFVELAENPVVQKHNGRDPYIIWHEPTQRWIMSVFNMDGDPQDPPPITGTPESMMGDNILFYSSPDLKEWTFESRFVHPDREATHECPVLFEIEIEGHPGETRYILYGVQNRYFIGGFNGHVFTPEAGPFDGEENSAYAAQMVSNMPDGRHVQIAGTRCPYDLLSVFPDQRFAQGFHLPKEVMLQETENGLRLFFYPVEEVNQLRSAELIALDNPTLEQANQALQACSGKLLDVIVEYDLDPEGSVELRVNGYPLNSNGSGSLRMVADRMLVEGFVNEGERVVGFRRGSTTMNSLDCALSLSGGGTIKKLTAYEMTPIW